MACIVGLLVGPGQFAFGSLGLFILPLQNEFGWSRTDITLATSVFTISVIFCIPVVGRLVDNYGAKIVLIPAMLTVGICLALIPLLVRELWHLYLLFFLIGSLGAAANSLPFMLAISAWFDRHRGLAIGLAMTGSGLGYATVPPLVQYINGEFGWRFGYYALAGIILFLALPFIYLIFKNRPEEMGLSIDGNTPDSQTEDIQTSLTGMTRSEALGDRNFQTLVFIFSLLALSLFGILLNMVPMLSDRGMASENALCRIFGGHNNHVRQSAHRFINGPVFCPLCRPLLLFTFSNRFWPVCLRCNRPLGLYCSYSNWVQYRCRSRFTRISDQSIFWSSEFW